MSNLAKNTAVGYRQLVQQDKLLIQIMHSRSCRTANALIWVQ